MTSYTAYLVLRDTDWSVKKQQKKKKETKYVIDDLIFLFAIKCIRDIDLKGKQFVFSLFIPIGM